MKGDPSELVIEALRGGCRFRLRVKPRASDTRVVGVHGGSLKVSVKEAPEKGRANAAVRALLASLLGVAVGAVEIRAGAGSQDKTVQVSGLSAEDCRARLKTI